MSKVILEQMNHKKALPFRFTMNDKDYLYKVGQINRTPDNNFNLEVEIEGENYVLNNSLGKWVIPDLYENRTKELIAFICKSLSLRYRI